MRRPIVTPYDTHKSQPSDLMLQVVWTSVAALQVDPRNARTHSKRQVGQIAASIERFGFTNPILIDGQGIVIAGHGRLAAAKRLGLENVPTLRLDHMSQAERRAYVVADNRLAELAGWDKALLAVELGALIELDFEMELTGFDLAEIDIILDLADGAALEDAVPEPSSSGRAVTRPGDIWLLGRHRLLCGSALEASSYAALMGGERAAVVFTDPPYNVPITGNVSGRGAKTHGEFAMASGEMTGSAFTAFLRTAFGHMAQHSDPGSISFVCMDWRHMSEVLGAGLGPYSELKNLVVWNKNNGGLGSLYRSKHELIFVFKNGPEPHVNTIELGRHGRNRTNVWDYSGQNSFRRGRDADLAAHPTVKPVALVADAIRDVTRRGTLVLDPFAGSGTTIMAAEQAGRQARAMELDPVFVDVAVRRWQTTKGEPARLEASGQGFDEVAAERCQDGGAGGPSQASHAKIDARQQRRKSRRHSASIRPRGGPDAEVA